jgi:hypothetical protein
MKYCHDMGCTRDWGGPTRGFIFQVQLPLLGKYGLYCGACFSFWENAEEETLDIESPSKNTRNMVIGAGFNLDEIDEGYVVIDPLYKEFLREQKDKFSEIESLYPRHDQQSRSSKERDEMRDARILVRSELIEKYRKICNQFSSRVNLTKAEGWW